MALLKVGALVIKQLTKPLAKRAKVHAKASPIFASQCIRVGNLVNQFTHYLNVRMLGGRILKVKPLDDAVAVERGGGEDPVVQVARIGQIGSPEAATLAGPVPSG